MLGRESGGSHEVFRGAKDDTVAFRSAKGLHDFPASERWNAAPWLWVLEPNTRAQRFYERRGAERRDARVLENPGGGTATYLRYAWTDPTSLLAAV